MIFKIASQDARQEIIFGHNMSVSNSDIHYDLMGCQHREYISTSNTKTIFTVNMTSY